MKRNQILFLLLAGALLLGGCSILGLGGGNQDAAATTDDQAARAVVPTFTATPPGAPVEPTATIAFDQVVGSDAAVAVVAPEAVAPAASPVTGTTPITTAAPAEAAASPTPAAKPKLVVQQEGINVRTGPGVNYGLGGTANKGNEFDIIAKNQAGDWWQVCCVNGEPVWVFGELATVTNAESVAVNESIAAQPTAAPVAAAPAPAAPAPAPAEPAPAPAEPEPAAPPANDPCAGIGGDGCKFKLRAGPAFSANGELKLTLGFIHSGVDGGQPQGSYFVVVLKDGENLGVSDSVRSFDPSVEQRTGPHGKYNYEYKINLDRLGGSVAGNYTLWVLDGNGERDSQDVHFSVPDGQGEVWMVFDQA